VVFNDAAYTCVKLQQQSNFGARYIDTDLRAPDFVALARAFGAESSLARSADELESQVRQAAGRDVLTLIEVPLPGRVW
jgi:acetolactate synthase-1/2/3 large subunit